MTKIDTLYPTHLPIGHFQITLEALDPVELAHFSAATLRGAFGWSFKRMVCFQPQVKRCAGCLLRGQCPYPPIFEPMPGDGSIYAGQQDAPSPYVLRPPREGKRRFAKGERFAFELVLMGHALRSLPYFAVALQQLEEQGMGHQRGRVRITRIEALHPANQGSTLLFDEAEPEVIQSHPGHLAAAWIGANDADDQATSEPPCPEQITIHFQTLTRLMSEGQMQTAPEFHVLFRALLRRVSALCSTHTAAPWETDFGHLVDLARGVETVAGVMEPGARQRHSTRQAQTVEVRGAQGMMVYRGQLAPFWPLLKLGEVIHVGKSCTFGLGQYRLL